MEWKRTMSDATGSQEEENKAVGEKILVSPRLKKCRSTICGQLR
jgi:hypothetical protein